MPLYSKIRDCERRKSDIGYINLRRVFDAPFFIRVKAPYVKKMKEIYKIFLKTVAFFRQILYNYNVLL